MNINNIYYKLIILISLNALINGCGEGGNSSIHSNKPEAIQSDNSSAISKINQAEADADKNRYENAIYGKTKYQ